MFALTQTFPPHFIIGSLAQLYFFRCVPVYFTLDSIFCGKNEAKVSYVLSVDVCYTTRCQDPRDSIPDSHSRHELTASYDLISIMFSTCQWPSNVSQAAELIVSIRQFMYTTVWTTVFLVRSVPPDECRMVAQNTLFQIPSCRSILIFRI
jgi:hypothetical protein